MSDRRVTAGDATPVTGWDAGYRPHLDGLRAVAVYLVVLFHAGVGRFSGGFIGVDVFFVLSGYLVTQLLLRDLSDGGSIRFGRFYSRRARRLLPAAFVTLVITAVVFTAIFSPSEVVDARGGFTAAFLYFTNWYFIAQSVGYFGADLSASPVLHFWSLAVEEQFYLLWPLLLSGLAAASRRVGPKQTTVLRGAVAVGALSSLVWAWSLKSANPNHAYYGTDARAYQLLAGALLALSPGLVSRMAERQRVARASGVGALAGLLLIATTLTKLDAVERGALVTLLTVALLAALEAASGGPVHRVLSTDPLVYLGKISYGTYLWHWPVIVLLTRTFDPGSTATTALTILEATALASLSFQVVERPIRLAPFLDRHRVSVVASGLATSVVAAVVIIPGIMHTTPPGAAVSRIASSGLTPVPRDVDWAALKADHPDLPNCYGKPVAECTVMRGSGPHVLLIGDSHAGTMIPAFEAIARSENLTLSLAIQGRCPWPRDLQLIPFDVANDPNWHADCEKVKQDLYDRVIPQLRPDIIVTMNLGYDQPARVPEFQVPNSSGRRGSRDYEAWLEKTTTESLKALDADGRKVVLIEPIPFDVAFDPLHCLSTATFVEACRYVVNDEPTDLEQLYRRLDGDSDRVWSLDIDRLVCPFDPICDPVIDQLVTKIDATHLARKFAESLAPDIDAFLKRNAILP